MELCKNSRMKRILGSGWEVSQHVHDFKIVMRERGNTSLDIPHLQLPGMCRGGPSLLIVHTEEDGCFNAEILANCKQIGRRVRSGNTTKHPGLRTRAAECPVYTRGVTPDDPLFAVGAPEGDPVVANKAP